MTATLGLVESLRDNESDPELKALFEQAFRRLLEIHHDDCRALVEAAKGGNE